MWLDPSGREPGKGAVLLKYCFLVIYGIQAGQACASV